MRYAVKIINLVLADISPATKLNSFPLGYFPIYLSCNPCKFVFFVLSAAYYQDYKSSMRRQPNISFRLGNLLSAAS